MEKKLVLLTAMFALSAGLVFAQTMNSEAPAETNGTTNEEMANAAGNEEMNNAEAANAEGANEENAAAPAEAPASK